MTQRTLSSLPASLALLLMVSGAALAQNAGGLQNGLSAGGPGDRTGSITSTGQTKPPGDALGPESDRQKKLDDESRVLDRQIKDGICKGCN